MTLDHTRYFGSTLYTLAWLYHNHADESSKDALARAYVEVEAFQRERWGTESPESIEDVERAKRANRC